jgi:hypothetical protein
VHDAVGEARQADQRGRIVQVAMQWRDPAFAQVRRAGGRGGQPQQAHPRRQCARDAQADVAAAHDEDALAAEAAGQGPERVLV